GDVPAQGAEEAAEGDDAARESGLRQLDGQPDEPQRPAAVGAVRGADDERDVLRLLWGVGSETRVPQLHRAAVHALSRPDLTPAAPAAASPASATGPPASGAAASPRRPPEAR